MAVVEGHPSVEELAAFTLGTAASDAVEAHLATCTACQERAAAAPGDTLVELLRSVHARAQSDTTPAVTQLQTPTPFGPAPTEGVPEELARHERYKVLRSLGSGGMGAVFEAEHRVMQRPVALKVIHRAYTTSAAAVERFRREVRAAARLSHPNIVTTYDAEDVGETQFLVMEYVEGVSLGRLVQERGPLPVAEACDYIRQAALGLQHAHERGTVHRDVKPENLIRCADGTVKVLDFGLAALTAERGGGLTDTNVVMGTPDYMAPEQAEDARSADQRADVYSLGCTLYYLLTGRVPYPATTAMLKILAHREQPTPSIRQVRPEVPAELARIMERMLAKKPEGRYATAGEVAAALDPFTRPTSAPPRRRLAFLAVAAAAVVLLLAAGVVYRIQTDTGELVITTESDDVEVVVKTGGKVVRIIDTKTDKSITLKLRSGVYELELRGAPEGLKLDVDKATLKRGESVLARIERVAKQLPDQKGEVFRQRWEGTNTCAVDLTSDGRLLLSAHWRVSPPLLNGVRVWDVRSGKVLHELTGSIARFTPDGKQIVTVTHFDAAGVALGEGEGCVRVYDTSSGKLLRRFGLFPNGFDSLVMCPDGRTAVTGGIVWDLTTGKVLKGVPDERGIWGSKEVAEFGRKRQDITVDYILPGGREVLGRHLIAGRALGVYDMGSGRLVREVPLPGAETWWQYAREYYSAAQYGLRWGIRMPVSRPDGAICVLDLESGKEVARLAPRTFRPKCLAISADDRFVAACASNEPSDLVVWRLPDPGGASTARDPLRLVHRIDWRTDGSLFGGAAAQGRYFLTTIAHPSGQPRGLRVWDGATGKPLWDNHNGHCANFSPDGELVYLMEQEYPDRSEPAVLRAYRSATGEFVRLVCRSADFPHGFILSPAGEYCALSHGWKPTKPLTLWRTSDGKQLREWGPYKDSGFTPDSKHFWITPEGDDRRRLYRLPGFEEVRLPAALAGYESFDLQPAGRYALARELKAAPEALWITDADGKKLHRWLPPSYGKVLWAEHWFNGQESLVALDDGTLRLFDVVTLKERSCFRLSSGEKALRINPSPARDFATVVTNKGAVLLFRLDPAAKGTP